MGKFHDRILALAVAIGLIVSAAGFAHAGPYEDALEKLTTDDYADTADAVTARAGAGTAGVAADSCAARTSRAGGTRSTATADGGTTTTATTSGLDHPSG